MKKIVIRGRYVPPIITKALKIMRLTLLFMIIGFIHVSASVRSQTEKISLDCKEVRLKEIFKQITAQTEIDFFYSGNELDANKTKSITVKEQPLAKVLKTILGDDFTCSFDDKVVIIKPVKKVITMAQQKTEVRGKVVDEKGNAMPGVTVQLEGVSMGTATDIDGNFKMDLPVKKGVLVFSFVGFKTKKVAFVAGKDIKVKLIEERADLDEVTVTAYGTTTKREMTGSITSVKAKDLADVPSSSVANLLQGRIAGMDVQNVSGAPGSEGSSTVIRGFNTLQKGKSNPLWVIDGVPVIESFDNINGTSPIADIDPSMIESIEVLKDAAAASLYGSRASNGVIMVTTKKGRKGETQYSSKVSYSYAYVPVYPDITAGKMARDHKIEAARNARYAAYDWASRSAIYPQSHYDAYRMYQNGMWGHTYDANWGDGGPYSRTTPERILQDSINPFYNNSTNWFEEMFRPGKVVDANVQAAGGTEKILYSVGAYYYSEDGIVKHSEFDRASLVSNAQFKLNKRITLDSRFMVSYNQRKRSGANGLSDDLPETPFKTPTFFPNTPEFSKIILGAMDEVVQRNENYRVRASLGANINIIDGLYFRTVNSIDYSNSKYNLFTPASLDWRGLSRIKGGTQEVRTLLSENTLNYKTSINGMHNIEAMAGYIFEGSNMTSYGGEAANGPSDYIHYVNGNFPWVYTNSWGQQEQLMEFKSNYIETVLISYIGRLKYNFNKKYMFEATFRRDGSSKFGKSSPWGFFPSFSAGYAFSEESYMDWLPELSFGKVRASWGKSGNTFDEAYLAYGVMEPARNHFGGLSAMTSDEDAGLFNKNLGWEETRQINIGLDVDLFDYRVGFVLDYYHRYTDKLLFKVRSSGLQSFYNGQFRNAGAISNEGLELSLKLDLLRGTDLSWKTTINIARNWNLYRESPDGRDVNGRFVIGKPVNGIYVLVTDGIINDASTLPYRYTTDGSKLYFNAGSSDAIYREGDVRFVDQNGDSKISTRDDKVYMGSPLPKAYGGILNEFKYKNFDLNFLFSYSIGRTILNFSRAGSVGVNSYNMTAPILTDLRDFDFWEKPGDNAKYPVNAFDFRRNYEGFTDLWLEKNVSYLKLKTFALGYKLPSSFSKKLNIKSMRLFVSGENLLTITNYKGLDPETIDVNTGVDSGRKYPLIRKFTFGVDIKF